MLKSKGFEVVSSCTASWWLLLLLLLLQISEPTNRTSMRQFCRKVFFGCRMESKHFMLACVGVEGVKFS